MSVSDDLTRSILGIGGDPMTYAIAQIMHVTAIDRYSSNIGKDQSANSASYADQIAKLMSPPMSFPADHPTIKILEANIANEAARAKRGDDRLDKLKQPSQGGLLQR